MFHSKNADKSLTRASHGLATSYYYFTWNRNKCTRESW